MHFPVHGVVCGVFGLTPLSAPRVGGVQSLSSSFQDNALTVDQRCDLGTGHQDRGNHRIVLAGELGWSHLR
jgi:hypothetical protein